MVRWEADAALSGLVRRYYTGEAGLWPAILEQVDAELRRRGIERGPLHLRFIRRAGGGYDVLIEDAAGYEVEP